MLLAELSTGWMAAGVVIAGLSLAVSVISLVWISLVATRTSKIGNLESELKETASELIDNKIAAITHLFDMRMQGFENMTRETATRCALLESKDHENYLKLLEKIDQLSQRVATREDVKQIREEMKRNG